MEEGRGYFIVYGLIMLVNISPGDESSSGTNGLTRAGIAVGTDQRKMVTRWQEEGKGGQGFTRTSLNALYTSSTL